MSDQEELVALLTKWVVGYTDERTVDGNIVVCYCFFTQFKFDAEGKFIEMGAWE